jgi:hypothetical protein
MNTLSLALYSEGSTDNRFLPSIIVNTARHILDNHHQNETGVSPIRLIEVQNKNKRPEAILQAAYEASENHALIVHADADHPKADNARNERFDPGLHLVQQKNGNLCKNLLPIIPIQAIEAWMLADCEMLLIELRTDLSARELGIPEKASLVESISKPKLRLNEAIARVNKYRRPHQRVNIRFLYEPLGQRIRLDRLKQLNAYKQFEKELTQVFIDLNLIPTTHRT